MSDEADQAQRIDERIRAGRIAHVRAQTQRPGFDECEDCGEAIDAPRCVECQTIFERRRR